MTFFATSSNGQDVSDSQATPSAAARKSFEALKQRDIATYAALVHPAEGDRFKTFATDVFQMDGTDLQVQQIRGLFAPFDTPKAVSAAKGSELFAAFMKNSLMSIPGYEEIMANADLEILGEITEGPDRVHVITRTVTLRPQPVSCQKHGGRWYLLLNDETMRMITAFRQKEQIRKNAGAAEGGLKPEIDQINVIGHVQDGDGLAQVLCRIQMKTGALDFSILGCYPVRESEPAWKHLNDKDQTKLVDALRSKWVR